MGLGVLYNIASINTQNSLDQNQTSLTNVLQQLSTGQKINSSADDPTGLAVATGLAANEAALTQSAANATDDVGFLQTADGALAQVTNLLESAVTVATETANGTLSAAEVSSANQEYQNILGEINDIGSSTNYNSIQVFQATQHTFFTTDGSAGGSSTYTDEVGALTSSSVGTSEGTDAILSNPAPTTPTTSNGATATFSLASSTDTISGTLTVSLWTSSSISVTLTSGETIAEAVSTINASTSFSSASIVASQGTGSNADELILTGPAGTTNTISLTGSSLTDTGTTPGVGVDFTASSVLTLTASNASTVVVDITTAIADVAYQRGTIGADIDELNAASNVESTESVNLAAAQNTILGTNYGAATSDLSKYQVLGQTGISALAQANSSQQEVLKLLQ